MVAFTFFTTGFIASMFIIPGAGTSVIGDLACCWKSNDWQAFAAAMVGLAIVLSTIVYGFNPEVWPRLGQMAPLKTDQIQHQDSGASRSIERRALVRVDFLSEVAPSLARLWNVSERLFFQLLVFHVFQQLRDLWRHGIRLWCFFARNQWQNNQYGSFSILRASSWPHLAVY